MDGLTALLAALIGYLRAAFGGDLCPGGWPWAVSALGIAIGLLPTAGAVVVAVLRRRIGSRYGVGESAVLIAVGLLTAGLLPLVLFRATGRVFAGAAAGRDVDGLSAGQLRDLSTAACLGVPQSEYLGGYQVSAAFDPGSPLRVVLALFLLLTFPLVAVLLVALQARLVLRGGPNWPSVFFWLPVGAVALLTGRTPAGSSGHLWLGFAGGALLGLVVVALVGTPREVARAAPAARPEPAPVRRSAPLDRGPQAPRSSPPARPPIRPPAAAPPPAGPPLTAAPPLAGAGGVAGAPRFRLVRRLGSGGFGRVWLADDAWLGHPVALKAAHVPDAETEQRIQREARALAAVRHRHCVRIHDLLPASSDPGLARLDGMVIVMEYVEGGSLGELVRTRGVLDDIAAARVWAGVAGALHAAHTRGVMHRDVKPGNIVVDPAGLAHLIDFGIARTTGDATMTMAGFVLGTPDFLAPEVACGERATPASDAWQLAATVSFALTGHPPRGSHGDAVSGLRAAATGAVLSHLPARSAHVALLRACLDSDPARRPPLPTAQQALENWLRRTGARPDGPVTAVTRTR